MVSSPGIPQRIPTLKQRLTASLVAAGFTPAEGNLPIHDRGGTFEIVPGPVGAVVRVVWWDSSEDERALLLEEFRVALVAAEYDVEERERGLYVAQEPTESG